MNQKTLTDQDEYSRATEILDTEYEQVSANLDDVIKTCETLYVEEHHQLKILLKNMKIFLVEYYQNQTCNTETISLQLMNPHFKPVYMHTYNVPRSLEHQSPQL
jgi:cell division septum initiation protein DivIVA